MAEELRTRVGWGEVVGVAGAMIRDRGIARFDLDELAAAVGAEPGAVRYWFQGETQLFIALLEIRQRWILDESRARLMRMPSQTARLREFLELVVADYDASFRIELWKLSLRDERARATRQSLTDGYRRTLSGLIRAGQRSREFGPASPDKVALVLASLTSGLSVPATLADPVITPEVMLDTVLDVSERLLGVEFPPRPAAES